jgi:hypothetical protein
MNRREDSRGAPSAAEGLAVAAAGAPDPEVAGMPAYLTWCSTRGSSANRRCAASIASRGFSRFWPAAAPPPPAAGLAGC